MTTQINLLEIRLKFWNERVALAKANCATTLACSVGAQALGDRDVMRYQDRNFEVEAGKLKRLRAKRDTIKEDINILRMAEYHHVSA